MRVGVVGNCQSAATARCLEVMLPDCDIRHFSVDSPAEKYPEAVADLQSCGVIISQFVGDEWGPFSTRRIVDLGPKVIMTPNLAFTAFHPDMVYLYTPSGLLDSAVGGYHSRITAACFRLGLSAQQARTLFNARIYARLGYFDEFPKSKHYLQELASQADLNLTWDRLMDQGVFLHTFNHATIFAHRVLAFELAVRAGRAPVWGGEDLTDDMLDFAIWPVYPEIAARAGLADGSLSFVRAKYLAGEAPRDIDLGRMIDLSYEIYSANAGSIDFSPIDPDVAMIGSLRGVSYS